MADMRRIIGKFVTTSAGRRLALLSAVAALLSGLTVTTVRAGEGAKQYNAFLESGLLYQDEAWQEYVTAVGERILAVSPHAGRQYTFVFLDDPMVNAYTTGDGYVFLTRGLISYLKSEDEMASVIGHEIGHNVGGHLAESKSRSVGTTILGWVGLIATSSPSMLDLANTLNATVGASYGRKDELEADRLGADWLIRAGYSPQGAIDSMRALQDNDRFEREVMNRRAIYHGIFASHPENQKRIQEFLKLGQHYAAVELREPERDFTAMLDGLTFGDQAANGVSKGNKFYHGGLRIVIEFPENWDAVLAGASVIGRAPAGESATINVQRMQPATDKQTPEQYARDTLKRGDLKNGESFKIGEFDAFVADIEQPEGSQTQQKLGLVFRLGEVYLFRGDVPASEDLAAFDGKFRATMSGLRAMTMDDLRLANTQRINIVEAEPGDTFEKLARGAPLGPGGADLLRVINSEYPNGQPRAGDLIKVVR